MLDLGALVARVLFDDAEFQTGYTRVVRQMGQLGVAGEKAASGTAVLDRELAATGKAGTSAAAGIDRATRSTTAAAPADDKAAAAASRHAAAVARVAAIMDEQAAASPKVQQATLRVAAAQERLNAVQESGVATARQLELAQANLIGSQRSLQAAMAETEVAAGGMRAGLAGAAKTAGQLGLLIGGIEIAKKALEFISAGKDLTDALNMVQAASRATDAQMEGVRAQAIAMGKDLTIPGATAVDAANAILELVKAGIALPRAMEAARPALLLAAATNSKMADTAKVLGDTMDIFSIKGAGAAHAANIIGASVLGASHDLLGFFDAMKQAGPSAQALGLSIDDVSTAITYLAKHGLSTSMGGAAIKTFLTNLTKDVPKGIAALHDLGVEAFDAQGRFVGFPKVFDQIHSAFVRFGPDKERFVKDLNAAFGVRSQSAAALFGKTTGDELDALRHKLETLNLQQVANEMNRGLAAGGRQIEKEFTAAGIAIYQKFEQPLTSAVMWLGTNLPHAAATAQHTLEPMESFVGSALTGAWHLFAGSVKVAADVLGPVLHLIEDMRTPLGGIATVALSAYLGFRLFQAIPGILETLALKLMYAKDATVAFGSSSVASARTFVASTTAMGTAATAAGDEVAAGGMAARIGWAGLLGPIGAVAIGIAALATMFHSTSDASKEATEAAKAYTDALAGGGGRATLLDAIVSQLSANDVPATIQTIKDFQKQIGGVITDITGKDFVTAIEQGGKPLDALRAKLEDIIKLGTFRQTQGYQTTPAADAAKKLLTDLNAQYSSLTKSQLKEIQTFKAFGQAVTPIQDVTKTVHLANDTALRYAQMMGFLVTKNNDVIGSSQQVRSAVKLVTDAYSNATTSTAGLLDAQQQFSQYLNQTPPNAARAALIAATLKAANGDALGLAGALAGATSAIDQLVSGFAQERQQLAQQSQDQASAADRVNVAQKRLNEVRGNSKATAYELASAEKSLRDAQTAAGKAGALAYADTMRAALRFKQTQDGLTASIDSTAKGAPALIQSLQGIQDAAVAAASAEFQDQKAKEGGRKAADDAYNIYVTKTRGALIDNAKQLGLTRAQAKALANQYLDTPKRVKTLIEAEGVDPVVKVLDKIGRLLANITGQQWNVKVKYSTTGATPSANAAEHDAGIAPPPAQPHGTPQHRAAGGPMVAGHPYIVHDTNRPELFVPGVSGYMYPDASKAMGQTVVHKSIHVDHLTIVQNYPEPDKDTTALPRALRNAGEQLASYL